MKKKTTIWLSEELLKDFKKKCIDLGKTMTEVINQMIKDLVKK